MVVARLRQVFSYNPILLLVNCRSKSQRLNFTQNNVWTICSLSKKNGTLYTSLLIWTNGTTRNHFKKSSEISARSLLISWRVCICIEAIQQVHSLIGVLDLTCTILPYLLADYSAISGFDETLNAWNSLCPDTLPPRQQSSQKHWDVININRI